MQEIDSKLPCDRLTNFNAKLTCDKLTENDHINAKCQGVILWTKEIDSEN